MDLQATLADIARDAATQTERGVVASYIPELALVDPALFGIAIALPGGRILSAGDAETAFSIQSISKVLTLALALGRTGDALWARVGREPSGSRFNSIVQLEAEAGRPRNPFINAGALVVTDALMAGRPPKTVLAEILSTLHALCGHDRIFINADVAQSEKRTGHTNRALAEFMKGHGNLNSPVDLVTGTYFHHCAVEMTCRDLALAGLAFVGASGCPQLISPQRIRRLNALMLTCGHYDASGDFAFRVGFPGKSGVGGGIVAIVPGRVSIAVWSPGLNAAGNSALGTRALEHLANATGWSVFG